MRAFSLAWIVPAALTVSAVPCAAQGLEPPLRSTPPRDSDRTTQQLTITASALGGFDDHLAPGGGPLQSLDAQESGYTGYGDVTLRYGRGRKARSFSLEGTAYLLSYSSLSIDSPVGGQVLVGGETTFGRANRFKVQQQVRTDPYVAFGAFGPLGQDIGPGAGPDANPMNGLAPSRSWGSFSSAVADWRWTPRTTLSTAYDFRRSEYIGDVGFDNRTHTARLALDRSLTRAVALTASYRYSDTLLVDPALNESWPVVEHTAEVGFDYSKAFSRTRRMEVSVGAGPTRLETVSRVGRRPMKDLTPSGHASVRTDIGRTWAVSADYRRGVAFLDGITPEFFLADVALLRTEGSLSRRVQLVFSSGYSNGKQPTEILSSRYDTFTLTAQAEVMIARPWSVVVNYNRNHYRFFGFPSPPEGPRSRFDTNAVRVGITYYFTASSARTERPARPGRKGN